MTRQQALDYYYCLQNCAKYLQFDKHYYEATRARILADDIRLIYHLTDEEIQTGIIKS